MLPQKYTEQIIDFVPTRQLPKFLAQAFPLTWEMILVIILTAVALLSRLWALGARVMSHDESLQQTRICELTGLAPLHSQTENWFAQLTAAPLPLETDLIALKSRLYDEYRVEG